MNEIIFGTPEHIAGLSREALEADFRYVQDRRTELEEACERLQAENAELRKERDALDHLTDVLDATNDGLLAENVKLREQTELLITLLRNDCDIDASWDGLRGFWSIGLTEDGCLIRDRACKAEAENVKLRELVRIMHGELVSCEDNGYVCGGHKFDERVRELGVEV